MFSCETRGELSRTYDYKRNRCAVNSLVLPFDTSKSICNIVHILIAVKCKYRSCHATIARSMIENVYDH